MAARVRTSISMSSFPLLSSVQKRPLPSAAGRRNLEDTAFLISPSVSWPLLPCDSLKEASHVKTARSVTRKVGLGRHFAKVIT